MSPQYVVIMLAMESALVACRKDANGDRTVSRVRKVSRSLDMEAP